jgi:hypothetical protein
MCRLKKKSDSVLKQIVKTDRKPTTSESETLTELLHAYFPHNTSEDETPEQQVLRQQMAATNGYAA